MARLSTGVNPYPNNPLCTRPADSGMRQWCRCLKCLEYERMRGLKKVRDKETGKEYTIDTFLSSQFLAMDEDGKAKFFFYKDRNVEWEEVK